MLSLLTAGSIARPDHDLVIASGASATATLENTREDILSLTVISESNDANLVVQVSPDATNWYPLYSGGVQVEIADETAAHITELACKYLRFALETGTNTGDGHVIVRAGRDARSV